MSLAVSVHVRFCGTRGGNKVSLFDVSYEDRGTGGRLDLGRGRRFSGCRAAGRTYRDENFSPSHSLSCSATNF